MQKHIRWLAVIGLCVGLLGTTAWAKERKAEGKHKHRAAKVDKNVLSQCNTQMILKVTNPNDLKAIATSVEGLTPGMAEEIQRLPIGVALVMGGNIHMPLLVEVRPRESRHGGESIEIVKAKRV